MSSSKYGWYSEKQIIALKRSYSKNHRFRTYKIYESEDGKEVVVSCVSDTIDHGCAWDDIKFVAKVVKFLRFQYI
jgi:hypothetical protein